MKLKLIFLKIFKQIQIHELVQLIIDAWIEKIIILLNVN